MKRMIRTVILLGASNVFMTFAWYFHLRFKNVPLWVAILGSWLLALPEYALHVPANRGGYVIYSATQLKILQEAITLVVFMIFAAWVLGEAPTWRTFIACSLLVAAVVVAFWKN